MSKNTKGSSQEILMESTFYIDCKRGLHSSSSFKLCKYENCRVFICDVCNRIEMTMGSLTCPCDNTRGWKAKYLEQMGKPHPPVKAAGRHRNGIQRRAREVALEKLYWKEFWKIVDRT
jgi:hypothetical protein